MDCPGSLLTPPVQSNQKEPTLRSSCNNCADAKVGCTKEKPVCSRCARRKEQCVYAITRRAGRRPRNKDPSADDSISSPPLDRSQAAIFQQQIYGQGSKLPLLAPAGSVFPTGYDLSSTKPAVDVAQEASNVASLDLDLDELLASHPEFPSLEQMSNDLPTPWHDESVTRSRVMSNSSGFQSDNGFLSPDYLSPGSLGSSEPSYGDSIFSNLASPAATTSTTPLSWSPLNTGAHNSRTSSLSSPQFEAPLIRHYSNTSMQCSSISSICSCHVDGQNLLSNLSPPNLEDGSGGNGVSPDMPLDFGSIMNQNERATNIVSEILRCSYPHDESLVFILSLIALKILGWYATAATTCQGVMSWDAQGMQPPTTISSGNRSARQHYDRAACQFVLTKTNNLQRIVVALSQQLLAIEQKGRSHRSSGSDSGMAAGVPHNLLFASPGVFQGSATRHGMARGLEAILRSRTRELSQALMNRLLEP